MRRTLALVFALLLIGGCSDDGEQPPPAATVPSEVTTSSTAPARPDPAVIPDDLAEIDEDYVQAVVDELFAVDAKATEIFVTTRTPVDERAIEYLRAIYTKEEAERQIAVWFQDLALNADDLRAGMLKNEVTRLIDVASDCIYVEVESDYSEVSREDLAPASNYLGLTPKVHGDDPEGLNPTAWMLFMDGIGPNGSEPANPCADR